MTDPDLACAARLGYKLGVVSATRREVNAIIDGETPAWQDAFLTAYRAELPERRRSGVETWQVRDRDDEAVVAVRVSPTGMVSEYRQTWSVEDWADLPEVTP